MFFNNKIKTKIPKDDSIKLIYSINDINKNDWNRLIGENNPFLEYDFFKALEVSKSIGEQSGWLPHYLCLYSKKKLIGLIPLFLKFNSYGEYIFDWSWASAYKQYGFEYYPKFVIAVPFTPVTGKRIFVHPDENFETCANKLIDYLFKLADAINVSSIHWLFTLKEEMEFLNQKNFSSRLTHQFHWKNRGYKTFEDFLNEFNSKKRNQIKRERRQANENIIIETLQGNDITKDHWDLIYKLYISTINRKWAHDYLKKSFFNYISSNFTDFPVLILAKNSEKYIAGALNFKKGKHLYGRYWGALEEHQCLHFEVCYYKAIEYAIKNNIELFEAGAQGEHKFIRGFLPEFTYSSHWIAHEVFSESIKNYLQKEKHVTKNLIRNYMDSSPFKSQH